MAQTTKSRDRKPAWRQWSEAEARSALAELATTGETAVGFARRKGVSPQKLQYWKKRLRAAGTPAFVAVTMPATAIGRREIELRIGDIVVVVAEDSDVEIVARLAEAISRRMRTC